jgi:Suppressor of fused protein (SUFU)
MSKAKIHQSIREHAQGYFVDATISEHQWRDRTIRRFFPQFRVLEISPGSVCNFWTFVSSGGHKTKHKNAGLTEFMIITEKPDLRQIQLLGMNAVYYKDHYLEPGDSYAIGEPWVAGSRCDHILISLPYPYGQDWEICGLENGHLHIYWLLPITSEEHEYKVKNGAEALEELFERKGLEFWKTGRKSVV